MLHHVRVHLLHLGLERRVVVVGFPSIYPPPISYTKCSCPKYCSDASPVRYINVRCTTEAHKPFHRRTSRPWKGPVLHRILGKRGVRSLNLLARASPKGETECSPRSGRRTHRPSSPSGSLYSRHVSKATPKTLITNYSKQRVSISAHFARSTCQGKRDTIDSRNRRQARQYRPWTYLSSNILTVARIGSSTSTHKISPRVHYSESKQQR